MKMKSMEELANESQINESLAYDEIIQKLNEAKENGTPLDEGLIGAIGGAILGAATGILHARVDFKKLLFGDKLVNEYGDVIGVVPSILRVVIAIP